MSPNEAVERIQSAYPQIYLACHTEHKKEGEVTRRDGTILAHLDREKAIGQQELQQHLGVAKSTLSEALQYLAGQGFAEKRNDGWVLTAKGQDARRGGSVLDWERLLAVVGKMPEKERARAVEGLELLAAAARKEKGK